MIDNDYKFFLDFNDNEISKDFLSEHSDLYKICMNPNTQNLGFINKNSIENYVVSLYYS